jgi:Leucine-rich repeat (LRR) protein
MNNRFLWLIFLLPLLFSCQEKYNKKPFDKKEEILRQYPLVETRTLVLDSLWDKRDSLTYLRLKNHVKNIGMNEVIYIPNWIGEFNKAEIFLVVNEKKIKIKKIPSSIGKLSNLLEFNIQNNDVDLIPETFYNLKKIKNIELENNKIETISPLIGKLENLQSFDIGDNPLKSLPNELCNSKQLKFLVLENTKITSLPKCLGNLQNLEWINILGTQLTEFPIEILNAPKLETIDAKRLKLKNYKEVKAICERKNIKFHYDEQ